jgi:uncharacterized protein involved in outer membrane biogenesis
MPFTPEFLAALAAFRNGLRDFPARLTSHPGLARLARGVAALVLACAHGAVLMALLGALLVPMLTERYLHQEASRAIGREIDLKSLRFNPFTFAIHASRFTVANKEGGGDLAGFSRLSVDLDPWALLRRRFKVARLILEDPVLHLVRDRQGRLNVADILPGPKPAPEASPRTFEMVPPGWRFSLTDIHITGGAVSLDDAFTGTRQELKDLHFSIDSLNSEQPGLHEIFDTGGELNESSLTLTVNGDYLGDHPEVEARLTAKNVVFRHYTPYLLPLKEPLDLTMDEAGVLVHLALARGKAGESPALVTGGARFSGVSLTREGERVASCEALEIQDGSLDPATGGVSVERVEVTSPFVRVVRDQAGIIDLVAMLAPSSQEEAGATGQTGAPPHLRVGEAVLKDGRLELDDRQLGISMSLMDAQARLSGLDTASEGFASLSLEATGDRFSGLSVTAKGSYAPVSLTGQASLEGADLSKPFPALERLLPKLTLSGTASARATYSLEGKDGRLVAKLDADMAAKDLRALAEGQAKPLLVLGELSLSGVQADTEARHVSVERVALSGGDASLTRDAAGRFSALGALPGHAPGEAAEPAGWNVSVAQAGLSGIGLEYQDEKAQAKAQVDLDEFTVGGFSSRLDRPLQVSGKGTIDGHATFELSGEVRPSGPGGPGFTLKTGLTGLPLAQLSRFFPPGPVAVLTGEARLSGEVLAAFGPDGPTATFTGDVGLAGLSLARPDQEQPWGGLTGLALKGVSFRLAPFEMNVASLAVDQPWFELVLGAAGRPVLPFDVASFSLVPPSQASSPASGPVSGKGVPGTLLPFRLGQAEVHDGRIDLTAQGFSPPFTDSLSAIQANLTAQGPAQPVKISLELGLGRSGVFKADGQAGWVSGPPFLDLRASLDDMDLGELSLVSQKLTGFPIAKGKLALKLDCKAGDNSLDFNNNILVTDIQLGSKAEVPGGKELPLDLAVSLLTNSKGVIDLDIPVRGSWSDAKADLSDVVSKAVSGAFARIFFSPLAFLNVPRSSGRTAFVDFAPGSAVLTGEAQKTLAALGAALADRPRLSLEVMAYADPASEAQAYAAALGAAAGAAAQAEPGSSPSKSESKPAAAWPGQPVQPVPPGEPARPPQPAQPVQPTLADWTRLARQRQDAVLAFLTGPGGVARTRVYPLAGNALSPPPIQGQPPTRAAVGLRY